jgi:hypothetical protein
VCVVIPILLAGFLGIFLLALLALLFLVVLPALLLVWFFLLTPHGRWALAAEMGVARGSLSVVDSARSGLLNLTT